MPQLAPRPLPRQAREPDKPAPTAIDRYRLSNAALMSAEKPMAKVLCVLYDDPFSGHPESYARDGIPKVEHYPGGQTTPSPKQIDFKPGELLGSVSGELGLRKFLERLGHTFVVTSDKDGENSVFERELPDAKVVISQPFWPAYLTAERIAKAKKLKLAITAGIGSDHVDLEAAIKNGVTCPAPTILKQ